jgi:hypothetical protein
MSPNEGRGRPHTLRKAEGHYKTVSPPSIISTSERTSIEKMEVPDSLISNAFARPQAKVRGLKMVVSTKARRRRLDSQGEHRTAATGF